MKLLRWKKLNKYTYKALAELFSVSRTTIWNILSDSYLPSDELMEYITLKTKGAVTKRDFPKIHPKRCPECGKIISKRYKKKECET